MKKCNDCCKELLDDSLFRQYCGSSNIQTIEDDKTKIVFKRCIDCGKELPEDSDFCQYCGSKRVAIVNGSLSNLESKKQYKEKKRIKPLFIILTVAFSLLIGVLIFENTEKKYENAETVVFDSYYNYGDYMFGVNAPKNESVYVYIKSKYNGKCLSYLVQKNCTVTTYLNAGDYEVYYAVGKHWHGDIFKFGLFTKYYVDKADFRTSQLPEGYGWVTTFEPLDNTIYKISANEFPK